MPSPIKPEELRARFQAARRVSQLLECREAVAVALRQVSDQMDEVDGGNGSAELQALFAQLKGLLDEITERLTRQATLDDLERRQSGTPLRDGTDRDFQRQCCEFSLLRAAAAAIGIPGVDARREHEVQQELARRAKENGHPGFTGNVVAPIECSSVQVRHLSPAMRGRIETRDVIGTTTPAAGPGGALIGTYTDPTQYIDVLRPAMAVRQAGARVLTAEIEGRPISPRKWVGPRRNLRLLRSRCEVGHDGLGKGPDRRGPALMKPHPKLDRLGSGEVH